MENTESQEEWVKQLELELEAFDDPEYCAQVAKFGDTGFEDFIEMLEGNFDYPELEDEM